MSSFDALADLVVICLSPGTIGLQIESVRSGIDVHGDVSGTYELSKAEAKAFVSRLKSVRKASSDTSVELAGLVISTQVSSGEDWAGRSKNSNLVDLHLSDEVWVTFLSDAAEALADLVILTLEDSDRAKRAAITVTLACSYRSEGGEYLAKEEKTEILQLLTIDRE